MADKGNKNEQEQVQHRSLQNLFRHSSKRSSVGTGDCDSPTETYLTCTYAHPKYAAGVLHVPASGASQHKEVKKTHSNNSKALGWSSTGFL